MLQLSPRCARDCTNEFRFTLSVPGHRLKSYTLKTDPIATRDHSYSDHNVITYPGTDYRTLRVTKPRIEVYLRDGRAKMTSGLTSVLAQE